MRTYKDLGAKFYILRRQINFNKFDLHEYEEFAKDIIIEVTEMMIENAVCDDEVKLILLRRNELI